MGVMAKTPCCEWGVGVWERLIWIVVDVELRVVMVSSSSFRRAGFEREQYARRGVRRRDSGRWR